MKKRVHQKIFPSMVMCSVYSTLDEKNRGDQRFAACHFVANKHLPNNTSEDVVGNLFFISSHAMRRKRCWFTLINGL